MSTEFASRVTLGVVLAAAIAVLLPFWAPLLLAVYVGLAARRATDRLLPLCHGNRPMAAALTVFGIAAIAAPLVVMCASLAIDAIGFMRGIAESHQLPEILRNLVTPAPAEASEATQRTMAIRELVSRYSERAFEVAQSLAGAAILTTIKLLVFFVSLYSVLVSGTQGWKWIVENSPLPSHETRRYGAAFVETGRGLVVGFGAAALAQGLVSMVVFAVLGVSQAIVLGVLTVAASIIPSFGSAVVWVPVAAGLAISGRTEAAWILVIVGVAFIGTIDNLIKPVLARRAALQLPTAVVLVSMLGGLLAIGATGIIVGPLAVRLAREGLVMRHERQVAAGASSPAT